MQEFRKILIAVDLTVGDRLVGNKLPEPASNLIEQAFWLGRNNSAELCFVTVLPPDSGHLSYGQQLVIPDDDDSESVKERAEKVIAGLVENSLGLGVKATGKVIEGKVWVELIREVLRENFDLVVAGTRRHGPLETALFGSTGLKLLRKCPCPVWLVKPGFNQKFSDILVAHDLTPVGEESLRLGAKIGIGRDSRLHVLHVLDQEKSAEANQRNMEKAHALIATQLDRIPHVASRVRVRVVDYPPAEAILDYILSNDIQLLVMGTIARTGIAGVFVGNTAEKLLHHIPCSVLAIKPKGFTTPITLDR